MNRRCHAVLAPLFAVLALLCGLVGDASAAINPAAQNPHYGENLLWEAEAWAFESLQPADPMRGNGEWVYDSASGVPVYVRQNPWTFFDPLGLNRNDDIDKAIATLPPLQQWLVNTFGIRSGLEKAAKHMNQNEAQGKKPDLDGAQMADALMDPVATDVAIIVGVRGALYLAEQAASNPDDAPSSQEENKSPSGSQREVVEENKVRIRHATSNEGADKIMEEKKIDSSSNYVYGQEAPESGSAPTKKDLLDTGAASADKVIEFDAKPSEYRKNEVGDVIIPKPVDLTDRNPSIIDVKE